MIHEWQIKKISMSRTDAFSFLNCDGIGTRVIILGWGHGGIVKFVNYYVLISRNDILVNELLSF